LEYGETAPYTASEKMGVIVQKGYIAIFVLAMLHVAFAGSMPQAPDATIACTLKARSLQPGEAVAAIR